MQYNGYLQAFIFFLEESEKLSSDIIDAPYYDLRDLDDAAISDEAKIRKMLQAIALFRSYFTR